ncbi:MAG: hypothetical protein ABIE70_03230 [bacterium]
MAEQVKLSGGTLGLILGDITDLDVDSFVYYAYHDLHLGSGFGTAISNAVVRRSRKNSINWGRWRLLRPSSPAREK